MVWILPLLLAGLCIAWFIVAALALPSFLNPRRLEHLDDQPRDWPLVSVIVTALDEESTIEPALRTLLASSYPNLELIAVNDRSRDGTGAVIDRLAREDSRLQPIHITELPAGWLGKVHAMSRGAERASGEWLLFTDADVHFRDRVIERVIAVVERERLDHFTLWPNLLGKTVPLRAALIAFTTNLLILLRPHRLGGENSRGFVGVGAFNLVRRTALSKTPGLQWLKMEIVDDTGLAKMMVEQGFRSSWRSAGDSLTVEWYPSIPTMIRGLEKNMYGAFSHFRLSVFLTKFLLIVPFILAPYFAVFSFSPWWLVASGLMVFGIWWLLSGLTAAAAGFGIAEALLAPFVGAAIMFLALARSTWLTLRNGGIRWRGTFYPLKELQAGARLKL
jgi:cellulose synthase/poly-beta-1,6-N-acetylglucosamine synthase-like glycosyltransferase